MDVKPRTNDCGRDNKNFRELVDECQQVVRQ